MKDDNKRRAHADAIKMRELSERRIRSSVLAGALSFSIFAGGVAACVLTTSLEQSLEIAEFSVADISAFILSDVRLDPQITYNYRGERYLYGVKELAASRSLKDAAIGFIGKLGVGGAIGSILCGAAFWLTADRRRKKQDELLANRVIRGTKVVSEAALSAMTAPVSGSFALRFGTISLPYRLENRHIAAIGTTGGGKTTALRQLLDIIELRGNAALIFDASGGDFVENYYDPHRGDIILNPFDDRGAFWNPFDEIRHPADASRIAHYLINETGDHDKDIWLETARNLVANILRLLKRDGRSSLRALLKTLQAMTREDLERWLSQTSSARVFEKDADRATASVLFMLSKSVNLLMFLRSEPRDGEISFSFSEFFENLDQQKGKKPWIFIPRKEDYFEAVRPLMALWLECAASALLGLSQNPKRRFWLVLDELAELPRVANLERLLPQGRKFGTCAIISFQAIGQMRAQYGTERAEALLGCCNTKLFLQMNDRLSRDWASDTIGSVELEIPTISDTLNPKTGIPQSALGTTLDVKPAVLESELRLPRFQAYLLLPDGMPVARINLTDDHIRARGPAKHVGFIAGNIEETLWSTLKSPGDSRASKNDPTSTPGPV